MRGRLVVDPRGGTKLRGKFPVVEGTCESLGVGALVVVSFRWKLGPTRELDVAVGRVVLGGRPTGDKAMRLGLLLPSPIELSPPF